MSADELANGSGKYQLLPPLSTEERDTLCRLIAADGVRVPVEVDENGDILDGHNRDEIARELGIQCPRVVVHLPSDTHKQAYAIKANLGRRQLSPEQLDELRKTQRDLAIRLKNEGLLSQAEIGHILGVDQSTASRWMAESIESNGSIMHVHNASVDLRLKLPPALHPAILQRAQAGETHAAIAADLKVTPRRVGQVIAKQRKRQEKERVKEAARPQIPCTVEELSELVRLGCRFGTIYADPPWPYSNQATRASTDNHYQTMTLEDITALPVSALAAADAHLHLWTTNAFLPHAFDLVRAWGFEYRSVFVWCKPQMGIGNYWRVSHEFLVLGIRGTATHFLDRGLMSWAALDRGQHSGKPEQVRHMLERSSPGPRLELFGRLAVNGWTVWGNEIERDLFYQGMTAGVATGL